MDFALDERTAAFRDDVRAFLAEHVTPEMIERCHDTGTFHDWDLNRAMAGRGWLAAAVPAELGGQECDPVELAIIFDEMGRIGAPSDGISTTMIVAAVIAYIGTEFQRDEVVSRLLSGEAITCLGYTEPDSGSDVAAAKTRAVHAPDWDETAEWIVNGQKMFTTLAHVASWVILLTRTSPDLPKHRGLTMFLVPMDSPGIEVQAVHTLGAERTNITFYRDVRAHDRWRLGEVDGGWDVMKIALAFERGVMGGTTFGVPLLEHAIAWASEARRDDGTCVIDDPVFRERVARLAADNEVARLLTFRAAWMASTGALPSVEGGLAKLYSSEAFIRAARWFHEATGAEGLLRHGEPGAPADGWIEYDARHAPVTTIYGGTSEIQRNLVAEQLLKLPRSSR